MLTSGGHVAHVAGALDCGKDEPWIFRAAAEPELLRLGDRGPKGFKAGGVEGERPLHFLGRIGGVGTCVEDGGCLQLWFLLSSLPSVEALISMRPLVCAQFNSMYICLAGPTRNVLALQLLALQLSVWHPIPPLLGTPSHQLTAHPMEGPNHSSPGANS